MTKKFTLEALHLEVEVGKFARQADGAAWIRSGNNIVLATAVATKEAKEFAGFFPLTVEYRERTAAAGKIPGGYIKREGRLSDFEVLVSRLIDRPIRPLFPSYYFNEVQILSTVYSSDATFPVDILALIGSSVALAISPIPCLSPIGAVRIGRINGEWRFNLPYDLQQRSDVNITVAGTADGISMVEGNGFDLREDELIDVLFMAHEQIKKIVAWQLEIARELGVQKADVKGAFDWEGWKDRVRSSLPLNFMDAYFVAGKQERNERVDAMRTAMLEHFAADIENGVVAKSQILFLFDDIIKEAFPDAIGARGTRIDGRDFDQIRPITSEIGILPCSHGSGFFQRGETQALVSVTLGTGQDVQRVEMLVGGMTEKTFMLHYNFPPFSTGEVKPMRGVGRREIGHGFLAESSFTKVLPSAEDFPYTIRAISDILESNGSSSMATVCGTTMALMDAGVPISHMVAGIAMGLIKDSAGKFYVLSDILGTEDAFGLMDFKVAGTASSITAVQMDIKDKAGLTREVLHKALEQALRGRLHILDCMRKVLSAPRAAISALAPRVLAFKVSPDKIGMIIGPAGKNIKEVIALTGTEIDIEDDGSGKIFARDSSAAQRALEYIKVLSGDIDVGATFMGKVKRHTEYGMFVDIFPGRGGLVHISSIDRSKQNQLEKLYPLESDIEVRIVANDRETGRLRMIAPALQEERSK